MTLYKWQQEYFDTRNRDKDIIAAEGGTGKTILGAEWLRRRDHSRGLIICPKRVVEKWHDAISDMPTITILSREQFKKYGFTGPSSLIVDEADEWASPLFIPKLRSQRSEKLYELIRDNPNIPVLLLTATPIRSTPWNLHTLLCFTGKNIDYKKWREHFFVLASRPYLPRPAWFPKTDWRKRIRKILEKNAYIVLMRDCVDFLPPATEEIVRVPAPPFIAQNEWEPMRAFVEEHKHEQKNKFVTIQEIGKEYRKVVVVCHYRQQIDDLKKELEKERETFVLHGGVKGQEKSIKDAQESDECYFIVQASLAAGYDLDTFSCVVFASMSYKYVDWKQMTYRVRRIHNLHPVIYYYLVTGRCDEGIRKTVMLGKGLDPAEYMQHATTTEKKSA